MHYRSVSVIFILAVLLPLCGCQFAGLTRELEQIDRLSRITGQISAVGAIENPVAIALFTEALETAELVDAKLSVTGSFDFTVKPGRYALFAFEDLNADFRYQPGEPAGFIGEPVPISVGPGEARQGLVITLDPELNRVVEAEAASNDIDPTVQSPKLWAGRRNVGAIVSLDDVRFDDATAKMGLWEPLRYSLELGPGVFALEPFDANKTPVLFVHGINGSPRNWAAAVEGLDRTRYQPWLFSYASGLPLEANADYLLEAMAQLQQTRRFEHFHVVAHSMGGLVSRSFLNRYEPNSDAEVVSFTTISTPWGGHDAAQAGIDYSPAIVPAWVDMAPSSDFLRSLRENRALSQSPHYLLFGYLGSGPARQADDDGAVSVISQLEPNAVSHAVEVVEYNAGHIEILSDPGAMQRVYEILDKHTP